MTTFSLDWKIIRLAGLLQIARVPPMQRLRAALKRLLRDHGLRVPEIHPVGGRLKMSDVLHLDRMIPGRLAYSQNDEFLCDT